MLMQKRQTFPSELPRQQLMLPTEVIGQVKQEDKTKKAGRMRRILKDSFRKVRALRARELREVTASLFFLALLY